LALKDSYNNAHCEFQEHIREFDDYAIKVLISNNLDKWLESKKIKKIASKIAQLAKTRCKHVLIRDEFNKGPPLLLTTKDRKVSTFLERNLASRGNFSAFYNHFFFINFLFFSYHKI